MSKAVTVTTLYKESRISEPSILDQRAQGRTAGSSQCHGISFEGEQGCPSDRFGGASLCCRAEGSSEVEGRRLMAEVSDAVIHAVVGERALLRMHV